MSGTSLDDNAWYRIYIESESTGALYGFRDQGLNYTTEPENSDDERWQLIVGPESYGSGLVIRSQNAGPEYCVAASSDARGNVASMQNYGGTATDDYSTFWRIGDYGDGTFYLWNDQFRESTRLDAQGAGGNVTLNSTIDPIPQGQRFQFESVSAIDDSQWSSTEAPWFTASSSSSLSSEGSSSSSSPSTTGSSISPSGSLSPAKASSDESSGLSTGAQVGIGVGVGLAALIAIVAGVFFFLRRRKHKLNAAEAGHAPPQQPPMQTPNPYNSPYTPQEQLQSTGGYTQAPPQYPAAGGYYDPAKQPLYAKYMDNPQTQHVPGQQYAPEASNGHFQAELPADSPAQQHAGPVELPESSANAR